VYNFRFAEHLHRRENVSVQADSGDCGKHKSGIKNIHGYNNQSQLIFGKQRILQSGSFFILN
jgi:hypothetical protein